MSNDEHELKAVVKQEWRSATGVRHASSALTTAGVLAFGIMMGAHLFAWRIRATVPPSTAGYSSLGDFYHSVMLLGAAAAVLGLAGGVYLSMRVGGSDD